mmetsp:Transcript_66365/g.184898  ORF Transcript_66365/g.184898 Transcript_66365/m.184898 type:complete len:221 (-) Transcript_66365:922-1584(-)
MEPTLWRYCKQSMSSASPLMPRSIATSAAFANGSTNIAVTGMTPSSPVVPSAMSSNASRSCTQQRGSSSPKAPPGARAPPATLSMQARSSMRPESAAVACELSTGKKHRPQASFTTICLSTPGTRSMSTVISCSTRSMASSRQQATLSTCVPTITMIASGAWTWIEESQKVSASSGGSKASSESGVGSGGPSRSPSRSQASRRVITRYTPQFVKKRWCMT